MHTPIANREKPSMPCSTAATGSRVSPFWDPGSTPPHAPTTTVSDKTAHSPKFSFSPPGADAAHLCSAKEPQNPNEQARFGGHPGRDYSPRSSAHAVASVKERVEVFGVAAFADRRFPGKVRFVSGALRATTRDPAASGRVAHRLVSASSPSSTAATSLMPTVEPASFLALDCVTACAGRTAQCPTKTRELTRPPRTSPMRLRRRRLGSPRTAACSGEPR